MLLKLFIDNGSLKNREKVGGKVDWKSVSPKEIQELTGKMFDAANVPRLARQEYYRAFN
ncbi:hypothetical protein BPADB04_32700 [Bacillus paranthracis]|nr:hypothetical protein BPADB04_32700 [Bacillus paranthracis]